MIPPIAMLHHVSDDPRLASLGSYRINKESFLRLLTFLEKHQYQTLTFNDMVAGVTSG